MFLGVTGRKQRMLVPLMGGDAPSKMVGWGVFALPHHGFVEGGWFGGLG